MNKIIIFSILNVFMAINLKAEDNLLKKGCELQRGLCFVEQGPDSDPIKFLTESEVFAMDSKSFKDNQYDDEYKVRMKKSIMGGSPDYDTSVSILQVRPAEYPGSGVFQEVTFANGITSAPDISGYINFNYLNLRKGFDGELLHYIKASVVSGDATLEIINREICDNAKNVFDELAKAEKCLKDFNEPYNKLISQINKSKNESSEEIKKFFDKNKIPLEDTLKKTSPFDLDTKLEAVDTAKLGEILGKCGSFFDVDYYKYKKEDSNTKTLTPAVKKNKATIK